MVSERTVRRIRQHLTRIYGEGLAERTAPRLAAMLDDFTSGRSTPAGGGGPPFDEKDVVVVAYGDQVREQGVAPLSTLRTFLTAHTRGVVSGLHLLPHYPATSDDGFAVADFSAVDPALGEWTDVEALAVDYRLMLDAVLNHTSASHPWFAGWLSGDPAYADFYVAQDPASDLRGVVRPRTTPLLTRFDAADGDRWAWTTFSPDQVDLNYANPEVLLAATEVLLRYVGHGARMLRLDAVAFLWKEPGTGCIHLPQTHEVIRLWHTVLDAVAPGTLLVTETNVPHHENVTYFGSGDDEAHVVYQFALPPLTLHAFHSGDGRRLSEWAAGLSTPSSRTTFLNFLASHDGIGLRPVEGLLSGAEVGRLAAAVERNGGRTSYRARPDGTQSPYELNTTYLDALAGPGPEDRSREVDRFVAAHSILLALAGMPMVWFQSLFGSRNWVEGVERTGLPRTINRQRFERAALERELAAPSSLRREVLDRLLERVAVRVSDPAFHPNAPQHVLAGGDGCFALQRTPLSDDTTLLCVHDVSGRPGRTRLRAADPLPAGATLADLVDGNRYVVEVDGSVDVDVPAYGVRWLRLST